MKDSNQLLCPSEHIQLADSDDTVLEFKQQNKSMLPRETRETYEGESASSKMTRSMPVEVMGKFLPINGSLFKFGWSR